MANRPNILFLLADQHNAKCLFLRMLNQQDYSRDEIQITLLRPGTQARWFLISHSACRIRLSFCGAGTYPMSGHFAYLSIAAIS